MSPSKFVIFSVAERGTANIKSGGEITEWKLKGPIHSRDLNRKTKFSNLLWCKTISNVNLKQHGTVFKAHQTVYLASRPETRAFYSKARTLSSPPLFPLSLLGKTGLSNYSIALAMLAFICFSNRRPALNLSHGFLFMTNGYQMPKVRVPWGRKRL